MGNGNYNGADHRIRRLPPPEFHQFVNSFYPSDPNLLAVSELGLAEHRARYYEQFDRTEQPLRVRISPYTGLPAFLNGLFLDRNEAIDLIQGWIYNPEKGQSVEYRQELVTAITDWFLQDSVTTACFGLPAEQVYPQLAPNHVTLLAPANAEQWVAPSLFVGYRQLYQGLPVVGGSVRLVVHADINRYPYPVAVTNSFWPLAAVGEKRQVIPTLDDEAAAYIANDVLRQFAGEREEWAQLYAVPHGALMDLAWPQRNDELPTLFILPFMGEYRPMYWIEAVSARTGGGWRLFVDALDPAGVILGEPTPIGAHAATTPIIASSADARTGQTTQVPKSMADLENDVINFLEWEVIQTAGLSPALQQQINQEKANVLYHTRHLFDHLTTVCGVPPGDLMQFRFNGAPVSPGLKATIGVISPLFEMQFVPTASAASKEIIFQTDAQGGIDAGGGLLVHRPGSDPEVIYHELVHGFTWLLNTDPFWQQIGIAPFARALVEGYATYLARSFAARSLIAVAANDPHRWASAAYRANAGWGLRWALQRNQQEPGADLLPAPNLYPPNHASGFEIYDVGMVWARALWDLRVPLGDDAVDRLAIDSYLAVHGWLCDFELAAEALIEKLRKTAGISQAGIAAVIDSFAGRNILAEAGVQALTLWPVGGQVYLVVGDDQGVRGRTLTAGAPWHDWTLPAFTTVIALAAGANRLYAATDHAVYRGTPVNPNQVNWQRLGGNQPWWQSRTLSLHVQPNPGGNDEVMVGSARGVWRYQAGNDTWQQVNLAQAAAFNGVGWRLARATLNPQKQACVVAAFARLEVIDVPETDGWRDLAPPNTWITALFCQNDRILIGTLNQGILRQQLHYSEYLGITDLEAPWQPLRDATGQAVLANQTILSLTLEGTLLTVGTTAGLFQLQLDNNWQVVQWSAVPLVAAGSPAMFSVLVSGVDGANTPVLAAGTTKGEVFIRRRQNGQNQWSPFG